MYEEDEIIAIFCICSDFLKARGFEDWHNCKMSTSEVLFSHLIATRFFYGNLERSRMYIKSQKYVLHCLSRSRLNRRLHQLSERLWDDLLYYIYEQRKKQGLTAQFIIDSFPVCACKNIRIYTSKLLKGESYRGYNASKREYFYGMKVTVLTTTEGQPVKALIWPGKHHDSLILKNFSMQGLPRGSKIYADSGYTDYEYEDVLHEQGIHMVVERRSVTKRPMGLENFINLKAHRQTIERAFAHIASWLPKKIHAVTKQGLCLKILGFVTALAAHVYCT